MGLRPSFVRRNPTEEQKFYLRGKQYEAEKMAQGGDRKSEEFSNGQNVHLKNRREIKDGTAGRIGKQYGVNGSTGKNAFTLLRIFPGESLWECAATRGTHWGW